MWQQLADAVERTGQPRLRQRARGHQLQQDHFVHLPFPSFTLNYGVRDEFARSPVERDNKSLVFSPEEGRILLAGDGVRPDIVDPDWNDFAPRLGFTWRPPFQHRLLNDVVVRGGAGIYYSTDNFNEEQFKGQGPPFFQARQLEGDPAAQTGCRSARSRRRART